MPQFINPPSNIVTNTDHETRMIEFKWNTDVPTKAVFAMMTQGTRGDFNSYHVQQVFDTASSQDYTIERPINTVEFYAIRIEANGKFNYFYGQMPQ